MLRLCASLGGLGACLASSSIVLPPDMAMLDRAGGAPPPACPPHCAPPVPGYSSINCTFIQPSATSTQHVEDYNRTGSYICSPASATAQGGAGHGKLLLFFTGTAPSDNTLFIQHAATLGFHAIALSYNNEGAPNGQCSDYPSNQTIVNVRTPAPRLFLLVISRPCLTDCVCRQDYCEFDVEEERLFGTHFSINKRLRINL